MRVKPGEIKIKFNLLTVKQLKKICDFHIRKHDCLSCPLFHYERFCRIASRIRNTIVLEEKVNLDEKMASRVGIVPKVDDTKRRAKDEG